MVNISVKKSFNREYSYAFVELEDTISAEKVIKKFNNYKLGNRRLRIEYQNPNPREKNFSYNSKQNRFN